MRFQPLLEIVPNREIRARSSALHKLPGAAHGATVEVGRPPGGPPGRPDHDLTNAVFVDPPLVPDLLERPALDYALSHRPRPHRHCGLFGLQGGGPLPGQLELALGAPEMPLGPQNPRINAPCFLSAFASCVSAARTFGSDAGSPCASDSITSCLIPPVKADRAASVKCF